MVEEGTTKTTYLTNNLDAVVKASKTKCPKKEKTRICRTSLETTRNRKQQQVVQPVFFSHSRSCESDRYISPSISPYTAPELCIKNKTSRPVTVNPEQEADDVGPGADHRGLQDWDQSAALFAAPIKNDNTALSQQCLMDFLWVCLVIAWPMAPWPLSGSWQTRSETCRPPGLVEVGISEGPTSPHYWGWLPDATVGRSQVCFARCNKRISSTRSFRPFSSNWKTVDVSFFLQFLVICFCAVREGTILMAYSALNRDSRIKRTKDLDEHLGMI